MKQRFLVFLLLFMLGIGIAPTLSISRTSAALQKKGKVQRGVLENFVTGEQIEVETPVDESDFAAQVAWRLALGLKNLVVLLVNFTDDQSRPVTREQVQNSLANTLNPDSFASQVLKHSYGRLVLQVDVRDWITIQPPLDGNGMPFTGCNKGYWAIKPAAIAAGVFGMYDHYMLITPTIPGCQFGGYADIVGQNSVLFATASARLAEHEIGHNWGRMHSRFDDYPASGIIGIQGCPMFNPTGDSFACEYGDWGDTMGSGSDGYNAATRNLLQWLDLIDSILITSNNPDQILALLSLESQSGLRDVAVPLDDGSGYEYHFQFAPGARIIPGLTVRLTHPDINGVGQFSYLVPGSTDHSSPEGAAMKIGDVFTDNLNGVKVTFISESAAGAMLRFQVFPVLRQVVYPGGKKITVRGARFGAAAILKINGQPINVISFLIQEDTVLKIKAKFPAILLPGDNTLQVVTATGAVSNVIHLTN